MAAATTLQGNQAFPNIAEIKDPFSRGNGEQTITVPASRDNEHTMSFSTATDPLQLGMEGRDDSRENVISSLLDDTARVKSDRVVVPARPPTLVISRP